MAVFRTACAAALFALQAQAYTGSAPEAVQLRAQREANAGLRKLPSIESFDGLHAQRQEGQSAIAVAIAAAGFGVGAVLGWLNSRRQQVASAGAAAAVVLSPVAATAMVDYEGVQYLGGSDKVDINNANVQAYRQFPGMYPTAAGQICSHGPYKSVADIYNIPGLKEELKTIMKKYEGNLVVLPANPAYFIDRINNGLYR